MTYWNQITVNITLQNFATTKRDDIKRHTLLAEQRHTKLAQFCSYKIQTNFSAQTYYKF